MPAVTTVDGIAATTFNLDRAGTWQITAASDTAQRSVRLIVTIPETGPVEVGFDRPTSTATATSTPTSTPTRRPSPSPTVTSTPRPPEPTVTATATPGVSPEATDTGKTVNFGGFFLSLVCLLLVAVGSYRLPGRPGRDLNDRVRRSLLAVAGGLLGYILFASGLLALERVPPVARAVNSWLPYQVLPVFVTIVFAALGSQVDRILPERHGQAE